MGEYPEGTSSTSLHGSPNASQLNDDFKLGTFSIDEYRPIKVVVIGAGFSGIIAGIRFPQRVPNLDLTIYDQNAGIGGTWYTNKYPGLACDIPSHCVSVSSSPLPSRRDSDMCFSIS